METVHKQAQAKPEQNGHAEHEAQPCAGLPAVHRGTHHNGHQHQGDGHGTEADAAAQKLEHHNDGGEDAYTDKLLCFLIHF